MDKSNRNAALAAALILLFFGAFAFFLPTIMLAVADYSMAASIGVAILFLFAFFILFWLRGRFQRRKGQ